MEYARSKHDGMLPSIWEEPFMLVRLAPAQSIGDPAVTYARRITT